MQVIAWRIVSEMTHNVSSGTFTHSLTQLWSLPLSTLLCFLLLTL